MNDNNTPAEVITELIASAENRRAAAESQLHRERAARIHAEAVNDALLAHIRELRAELEEARR